MSYQRPQNKPSTPRAKAEGLMARASVRLPAELKAQIVALARREDRSLSQMVRIALRMALQKKW